MLFGTILGKKYPLRKYVNVIIITTGVALFMGGGSSTRKAGGGSDTTLMGAFHCVLMVLPVLMKIN
jgi:UDP-galactose transporter B1